MSQGGSELAARRAPHSFTRLSPSGALSLAAVCAVLLSVSIPRLNGFALQENEIDAKSTALLLARELAPSVERQGTPAIARLLERADIRRALPDAELLGDGDVLRRHGYLFTAVELPPSFQAASWPFLWSVPALPPGSREELGILAWPWKCGGTGTCARLATPSGRLYVHPNQPARWEGPAANPALGPWSGWRAVR